jgi:ribosomal protein S13
MRLREATIELDGRATELDEQYRHLSREIDSLSTLSEDLSRLLNANVAAVVETIQEEVSGEFRGRRRAAHHPSPAT